MKGPGKLKVVDEGYAKVERLLAYEIGSRILGVSLAMQRRFGLRAEPFQILFVVMLASIQRYVRTQKPDPDYLDHSPLPDAIASHISRRRIADALGIPVETVRRYVEVLIRRGLIIEQGSGRLTTPPGTLQFLTEVNIPRSAVAQSVALVNLMLRHHAAQFEE